MAGWRSSEPVSLFCDRGQVVFLAADQMVTSRSWKARIRYRRLIPDGFTRSLGLMACSDRLTERIAVLASAQQRCQIRRNPIRALCRSVPMHRTSATVGVPASNLSGEALQIAFNVRFSWMV